jgi:hypothetical protein
MAGIKPTVAQVELMQEFVKQQLEKKDAFYIDIKEGFLTYEKSVQVIVTDERENPALAKSIMDLLQIVAQAPQIITTPAFQKVLDMVGMTEYDVTPQMTPTAPVAAPAAPLTPQPAV